VRHGLVDYYSKAVKRQKNLSNLTRTGVPVAEGQSFTRHDEWEVVKQLRGAKKRRARLVRGLGVLVAVIVTVIAFAAGYQRKADLFAPLGSVQADGSVISGQNLQALERVDEAVRARYEERWQGAMNALREARLNDPAVRGVDVLLGEIAVEQKNPAALRQAAREALRRGENESSAYLLLALEAWMQRGETGTSKAGDSAKQYLADAADDEPSNPAIYFFRGELSRLLGAAAEAQLGMVSALHRQAPWKSSALLALKVQLASRESSAPSLSSSTDLSGVQASRALSVRDAVLTLAPVQPALNELISTSSSLQLKELLEDLAFREAVGNSEILAVRKASIAAISCGQPANLRYR
jgi:hypothetical protein